MITTKESQRIARAAKTILLAVTLAAATLAVALASSPETGSLIQKRSEAAHAAPARAATGQQAMSPAQALSNGKPTLFFFYPVDTCRIRYCRQPADVEVKLRYLYNDQINFVPVGIMAITYGPNTSDTPQVPLSNWEVYPVEPYADWLPLVVDPETDVHTASVTVALVDAAGKLVYQGGEFFSWEELGRHLEEVTEAGR